MIVPELAHFFDQGAYDGRREASRRPWQPRWDIAPRVFRIAASFGQLGRLSSGESVPLDRSSVTGRSICDLQHLPDDPTGPRPQTKNLMISIATIHGPAANENSVRILLPFS
jgi:hypothetical protein